MPSDKHSLIRQLKLEPHIEGGWFRRIFEASHRPAIETDAGARPTLTAIHYLLTDDRPIGHWHLNCSDILHFFHAGAPIDYYLLDETHGLRRATLGPDPDAGHQLCLPVEGGTWKASHLREGTFGLLSEAVSPGFDYADMTLGRAAELTERFPQHRRLIERFSKPVGACASRIRRRIESGSRKAAKP